MDQLDDFMALSALREHSRDRRDVAEGVEQCHQETDGESGLFLLCRDGGKDEGRDDVFLPSPGRETRREGGG